MEKYLISQTVLLTFLNQSNGISKNSPFVKLPNVLECIPCIIDPNTKNNVAKSSFRIMDIKESFSVAYDKLSMMKIFYESSKEGEKNILNELLNKH